MGLTGTWKNEFGSIMDICVDEKGLVSGTYSSHTGATGCYRVTGVADTIPDQNSQCVSFSISWRPLGVSPDDPSFHWVSAFAGQLQVVDGEEILFTTYLLAKNTTHDDNWEATVVDKCTFRRISSFRAVSSAPQITFNLERGKMTDNGATPWFANIPLGTPGQTLKYMLDTGTTHTWVTSTACTTEACRAHQSFCPEDSSTSEKLPFGVKQIDFGPWGSMDALLYQDYLGLSLIRDSQNVDVRLPVRIYLSTNYSGDQFLQLACDGGIAIPRRLPKGIDSTELLPFLRRKEIIAQSIAAFWFDPDAGKGQIRLGAIDPTRFNPESVNRITVTKLPSPFDYLWTIPLESFDCKDKSVLADIPLVLDTGSSVFKGDPNLIKKIVSAITQDGAFPSILYGPTPDFKNYPLIGLQIGAITYQLTPEQYFIQIKPDTWELAFQEMQGLDGFILAGSVFLDTVYSAFYYETESAGVQEILLATPVKSAD